MAAPRYLTTLELDPRLIRVTITVGAQVHVYDQNFEITVSGTKYANALMNEAEVTIENLQKDVQDFILTATTPYALYEAPGTIRTILIEAGRVSYGLSQIYFGNIYASRVSQPPDIKITLRCFTGFSRKSSILSLSVPGQISLSHAAQLTAQNNALGLNFAVPDINIQNYTYNGSASGMIPSLAALGGLTTRTFNDDQALNVLVLGQPLGSVSEIIASDSGMVGIPEFTEQGIKVKYLLSNRSKLGGALQIVSTVYPAANGTYVIYKLSFDIASRDTPFYYIAEASRIGYTVPLV